MEKKETLIGSLFQELPAVPFFPIFQQSACDQVACALDDATLRLVDLRLGRPVNTMQGHTKPPLPGTRNFPFIDSWSVSKNNFPS